MSSESSPAKLSASNASEEDNDKLSESEVSGREQDEEGLEELLLGGEID